MTDTVAIIHVCKPDYHISEKWLRWARWLSKQKTATPYRLVVFVAQALEQNYVGHLRSVIADWPEAEIVTNPDGSEPVHLGYAACANLALKAALTHTEQAFPGKPTLWVEADCIPTRPSWLGEIDEEYKRLGKPFLGDFHALGPIPHLTGNAVYPPNWRKLAPSIAALPNPNPAQGWDTLCAHETVPQSAKSNLIQQAWIVPPPHFTETSFQIKAVHSQTALFHRCKDGSLIDVLAKRQGCPHIQLLPPLQRPTPTRVHRLMHGQTTVTFQKEPPKRPEGIHTPPEEPKPPEPKEWPEKPIIQVKEGASMHILMCSHARDADFTEFAIRSYVKYAKGFSGLTLLVPSKDVGAFRFAPSQVKLAPFLEAANRGFLHHMIQVCRADEFIPDADLILHLDPDCLFWRDCTPESFAPQGKPILVREPYSVLEPRNKARLFWRTAVHNATGHYPIYDTMVRHPQVYPRQLYAYVRKIVETHTKQPFDRYVFSGQNKFPQAFCEYNTLGNIALRDFPELFTIVDYDHEKDAQETGVATRSHQYIYRKSRDDIVEGWSHGGITRYRNDWMSFMKGLGPQIYVK